MESCNVRARTSWRRWIYTWKPTDYLWKGPNMAKHSPQPPLPSTPGHQDFEPNERADKEAKKAAMGDSSDAKLLPALLRKRLPLSVSALRQENTAKLTKHWVQRWKSLVRESLLKSIDNTGPSKKYLCLIKDLDRRQASLLFQLCSDHVALNHHLFRIRRSEMPSCPHCQGIIVETVKHFLLDCPQYVQQHHKLHIKLCHNTDSLCSSLVALSQSFP